MKIYFFVSFAALLATQATDAFPKTSKVIPDCSPYDDGEKLPDINSCSQYYLCVGGKSLPQRCARGLYFDAMSGLCNRAFLVDCTINRLGQRVQDVVNSIPDIKLDIEIDSNNDEEGDPPCNEDSISTTRTPCTTTTTPCTTTAKTATTSCTTTCKTTTCKTTTCKTTTCKPTTSKTTKSATTTCLTTKSTKTACTATKSTKTTCTATKSTKTTCTATKSTKTTCTATKSTKTTCTATKSTKTTCTATKSTYTATKSTKPTCTATRTTNTTCTTRRSTKAPCSPTTPPCTTTKCSTQTTACSTADTNENKNVNDKSLLFLSSSMDCYTLPEGTILLDYFHCRRYYVCNNQRPKRKLCRTGYWIDQENLTCHPRSSVTNCAAGRN